MSLGAPAGGADWYGGGARASQSREGEEARIESMRRRIGLRILNQQLANGWSAWHEMYSSRVYAIKRLRTCARRLKAPLLVNAFGAIKYQWREVLHARAMESRVGDAEADLRIRIAALEAEVGEAREEMARRLKGAAHAMALALERQRIELSGSAEEQAAAREAVERSQRVDLVRRQMVRRIMSRDLALGWSAWLELYHSRTYAHNKLRRLGIITCARSRWRLGWVGRRPSSRLLQKKEWSGLQADKVASRMVEEAKAELSRRTLELAVERERARGAADRIVGARRRGRRGGGGEGARIEMLRSIIRRMLFNDKRRGGRLGTRIGWRVLRRGVPREELEDGKARVYRSWRRRAVRSRSGYRAEGCQSRGGDACCLERQRIEPGGDAESQRSCCQGRERDDLLRAVYSGSCRGVKPAVETYHARIFAPMTMKRVIPRHPRLNSAFQVLVAYRTRVDEDGGEGHVGVRTVEIENEALVDEAAVGLYHRAVCAPEMRLTLMLYVCVLVLYRCFVCLCVCVTGEAHTPAGDLRTRKERMEPLDRVAALSGGTAEAEAAMEAGLHNR